MNTNLSRTRLAAIMLVIIMFLSVGILLPTTFNQTQSAEALAIESASDSMTLQIPYGLYYYLNTSESMVIENISEKLVADNNANPDKITITSCTSTQVSMVDVPNISQSELARKVGVARSTIARMERNLHSMSLGTFTKLLEAMNYKLEIAKKEDINE